MTTTSTSKSKPDAPRSAVPAATTDREGVTLMKALVYAGPGEIKLQD